ncbi:MAG: hypothetical protein Q9209_001470 [Squamulea sp. 1 TL-2023]
MQHVPPKGKEPNERPIEAFAPNPERANVFEGYTFVFCDKGQFESLQGPITNGGGKATYFALKPRRTTTEELVGYVKNVAGEKGLGELEDGSEGKGVVVVKFRGAKDDFDWSAELVRTASLALDLRFIEQNEFMDAILMNDASSLRRPLEMAEGQEERNNDIQVALQNGSTSAVQHSQPEPEIFQPPPQPRQRGMIKSRFKGFSDDSDDDMKPPLSSVPQEGSQMQTQTAIQPLPSEPFQHPNQRKRPAPVPEEDEEDEEDLVDQLLPANAAIKRVRLQETEAARLRGESPPTFSFDDSATPVTTIKKPPPPELDIKKSLRERREAADRAAARDQEALHEDISVTDIEAMRNLAVVEEFDVVPHAHRQNGIGTNGNGNTSNPRWDPSWNGRKNFKKFRRQGDPNASNVRRGGQSVIVPLEEVHKKTFGMGEEYWLENSGKGKRKRGKETQSQSQAAEENLLDSGAGAKENRARENGAAKKNQRVQALPKELKLEENADESMDDVVDVDAPRRTRGMDGGSTQTQTSKSKSQTSNAANAAAGRKAPTKTQKMFDVAGDDESDSEDELKFRFGKRRRMGK